MTSEREASETRTYALGRLVERAGGLEVELAFLAITAGDTAEFPKIREGGVADFMRHVRRASRRGVFSDQTTRVDAVLDRVELLWERRHTYIHGSWNPYANTLRRIRDMLRDETFDADRPFDQNDLDELVSAFGSATDELDSLVEFTLARR